MEEFTKILSIAFGGALGALARYGVNLLFFEVGKPFPLATFLINISGSFLIGFLMIIFADKFPQFENLRMALMIGFLGAFTTFSTFEMEIFSLLKEGAFFTAALYVAGSILLGLIGLILGVALARNIV